MTIYGAWWVLICVLGMSFIGSVVIHYDNGGGYLPSTPMGGPIGAVFGLIVGLLLWALDVYITIGVS